MADKIFSVLAAPAATAAATGAFTITLRFINPPTAAQRAFFETAAADRYHVSGRQERVAGDVTSARLNLGGRERLIQPSAVVQ